VLRVGSTGVYVREAQNRLRRVPAAAFTSVADGKFGAVTRAGVLRFQRGYKLRVTGTVDAATWTKLIAVSDPVLLRECLRRAKAICASKATLLTYGVVNGKVVKTGRARFGSPSTATREGYYRIYLKRRYHVSTEYHTPMPYAMYFDGGEAFHYSADFARYGYKYPNGTWRGSHGCVNSNSMAFSGWLFATFPVGTPVYVV
jgi:hypothetical protein